MTKSEYHKGMTSAPEGQATLNQFYKGNRTGVIETPIEQRRGDYYMDTHPIQQPLGSVKPYHKGHRYLFVFRYDGQQPIHAADSVSTFGKYGTITKARYNYHEDKAIVFSYPHSLLVWITHPKGDRTAQELAEAHKSAWRVAESFSRKHGIAITSEKDAGFSEHTIENKPLDSLIRPIVLEEPELAKEKLGLSINQTSHKNKVEWTGKPAKERVMELERLLDADILGKIDTIEQGVGALAEGQGRIMKELERRRSRVRRGESPLPIKPMSKDDEKAYR
jgi:hypothetical protein